MLQFKKDFSVEINDYQEYVEDYPDEKEMDYVNLDDERKSHWRMVFEENDGGVDDTKELLHGKRWDVYFNKNKKLVKSGY